LFELLKSLVAKQGLTVLAILHDITLARRYADSAVLMKSGRVQSAGNIQDVLNPGNIADVYDIPVMLAAEI
jgi:iron complex transport system ATP-binding protein